MSEHIETGIEWILGHAMLVIVAVVALAGLCVVVSWLIPKKKRTSERIMQDRDRALSEYDRARETLARMPGSMWRQYTRDEIDHQRSVTDALREKVRMLEDELGQVRAKGGQ